MITNEKFSYVKPAIEDLGSLANMTQSQDFPNADDGGQPAPSANQFS